MSNLMNWARFWARFRLEREGFDAWSERDTSQDEAEIKERLEWIGEKPTPKQFAAMVVAYRNEAKRVYRAEQERVEREAEDAAEGSGEMA
jgi:hypothetical protein